MDGRHEMLLQTFPANEEVLVVQLFVERGMQVLVVEPILTLIALNHELVQIFFLMRLLAIAIAIKEVIIIHILFVLIVFLVVVQLTSKWHSAIAAIAFKIQPGIQFNNLVLIMTVHHASQTNSMRLYIFP